MLAVVLFVLFWVILGFSLFFVAVRGGPAGARETLQTQTRGGRRALEVIFIFIYVGFGIVDPDADPDRESRQRERSGRWTQAQHERAAGPRALRSGLLAVPHAGRDQLGRQGRPQSRPAPAARQPRPQHDQERVPAEPAAALEPDLPGLRHDACGRRHRAGTRGTWRRSSGAWPARNSRRHRPPSRRHRPGRRTKPLAGPRVANGWGMRGESNDVLDNLGHRWNQREVVPRHRRLGPPRFRGLFAVCGLAPPRASAFADVRRPRAPPSLTLVNMPLPNS